MSLSGISSSSLFSYESQNVQSQSKLQKFQQEFQQLGQDLQSGNLSAAQSDFATLQQIGPQGLGNSPSNSSPVQQAFNQLAQDLQSGNISAAQQDYTNIQQDFQGQAGHTHGHHHHHGGGVQSEMNQISQTFQQLGQALQSGSLSSAQQIYSTLQQEIQQLGGNNSSAPAQGTATGGVSVSA